MPIQILHAADFHLDAPFASLNAEQAAERRGEQRELLARLAELARSRGADLVLLSGDLFDGGELYAETGQALVRTLGQTGCPVFIAPGNHDFYSARSPYARLAWPDNVHLFRRAGLTPVELEGKACTVWGAAFTAPAREDSPLAGFAAPADGRLHLGVLHGDVEGRGRYGPIGPEEIAASGLTYLALGHIHARSGLRRAGETFWAYPGCPEGRGFDELGDKGFLTGTVEPGQVKLTFVPFARHRYQWLTADVTGVDPLEALRRELPPHPEADIFRMVLTGETEEPPRLDALYDALSPDCFYLELQDRTTRCRDLWEHCGEDTLRGLFLRDLRQRYDAAPAEEKPRLLQAARFGLAALENREL